MAMHFLAMQTERDIAISDALQGGRNGQTRQPSVKKKSRFPIGLAVPVGAAVAGLIVWHFLGNAKAPAHPAPVPPAITVQTLTPKKTRIWNNFSGRLKAVDSADIRPEVSGRITEVRFQDGQMVKAGDILFVIEPSLYEAAVAQAEATIASDKANLQFAALDQSRNDLLLKTRVIAQRDYDQTNTKKDAATAALLGAQAELKKALVDLDHAYVKAPISGRVSRAELTVGNLVLGGSGASAPPPLLASIVSNDGIYADFEVDEQTYLETIRDTAKGSSQEKTIPVELSVQGGTGRVYKGFIETFDNRIDVNSGTIRARAKFDNKDQTLVPGMFVSVRLASSYEQNLLLVSDRAIGFDQSKEFVFIVTSDNTVRYREVDLGTELGGQRVVLKGLDAGDRVIVDGVQRVHPGDTVDPKELNLAVQDAETGAPIQAVKNDSQ